MVSCAIEPWGGTTMCSLYLSALREAFGNHSPKEDENIRSVLGAVVLAPNRLSPSTIATLLGLDPQDVSHCLKLAEPLLILDHFVQPIHQSFSVFLTDKNLCPDKRFYVSAADHHGKLLIPCLNLMNERLKGGMHKNPDTVENGVHDELYIDEALEYACTSWYWHLVGALWELPDISQHLKQFRDKEPLWEEVHDVLEAPALGWRGYIMNRFSRLPVSLVLPLQHPTCTHRSRE